MNLQNQYYGGINMKKKYVYFISIFLIGLFILLNTSLWFPIRSYFVMFFYSKFQEEESLLNKYDIYLKIPGGLSTKYKDWYPFVMIFNDDVGFSEVLGRDASLTILYNFGYFKLKDGSSSYYDPNSRYFSSFYGGYLVKHRDKSKLPFGFNEDGKINLEEISLVPKYDQEELVLRSLGCPRKDMRFDVSIDDIEYDISYVNHDDWVRVNSTIITNSPLHRFTENRRAYIQYGKPIDRYYTGVDFPLITLKGRTYVKYLKEYDLSLFLYILAPTMDAVEECDKNILSKTILEKRN